MPKVKALDAALSAVWAMEEQALENLLNIAAREHDVSYEALEAYSAKRLANAEQAKIRDGVAIINANGPLFKRANMLQAISGATSYEIMMRDLQAAKDAGAHALLLNIDSPGGEASGMHELAQAIYDARDTMHIVAYVGGSGASAAYWLASAAHEIVVDPTAILGSIGVQVAFAEPAAKAGEKVYKFVSSQSPNKNAPLSTEGGRAQIQQTIDAMAQVFVEAVARNRGVATETVLTDFGQGGIFVGKAAVEAGLADSIGSFEAVLADLAARDRRTKNHTGVKATMADEVTFTAEQRNDAVNAAVTAERGRVAGLTRLATAHNAMDQLNAAIEANTSVADFALALADAAIAAPKAEAPAAPAPAAEAPAAPAAAAPGAERIAALKTDEEAAAEAAASTGKEPEGDTVEAVAARIAAA
jgi:ClpP class serine protease